MIRQFDSLFQLFEAFPDEQSAIDHLTAIRWKDGAFCPYCNGKRIMHFSDKRTHKCADCQQRFSIKVGTIFEGTKLPLRKWFAAIWLVTSHKKGIASTTLARDLKITQKSAWFVLHRLRYAAKTKSFNRPLEGEVEMDESFIGGKEANKHASKRKGGTQGGAGKVTIFGLLERGGEIRVSKVDNLKAKTIREQVQENVKPGSSLMTDEHSSYTGLKPDYYHFRVNHSAGEYVRWYFIHVNGIEGAWSLFKRQIYGIHHWVSEKHVQAYLDEMCYRYNRREMGEGERVNDLLDRVSGRLTYKALISAETDLRETLAP
jgi:transposase-like protein